MLLQYKLVRRRNIRRLFLKRCWGRDGQLALSPSNAKEEELYFPPADFEIQVEATFSSLLIFKKFAVLKIRKCCYRKIIQLKRGSNASIYAMNVNYVNINDYPKPKHNETKIRFIFWNLYWFLYCTSALDPLLEFE